jgi:hypothetical protein
MTQISTLRPGLLVVAKSGTAGNVTYRTTEIEPEHITADGELQAVWETAKTVADAAEHARAVKVRTKALTLIRACCAQSAFGLLCPERDRDQLDRAIAAAHAVVDEFNASATLTRVSVNVIVGRIAADDVEAVRAINSEVRDLLARMDAGVAKLDPDEIRDAANRAKGLGQMLSPEASGRVQVAINAARLAAREIVKAGEQAAVEVTAAAIAAITETRTAFLDLDDATEVAAPTETGRALDFEPVEIANPAVAAPAIEF